MVLRIDRYHRLESRPGDRDLQNGFAARVHDPLWLLARQWQMGEHQGENASSPVRIDCTVTRTPIAPLAGDPAFDPTVVPAEALVESELDDWWTIGRRVRVGERFAANPATAEAKGVRFLDPPPPYDAFAGRLDGRAIWLGRERLGIAEAAFGGDAPPADSPQAWDSFRLNYNTQFDTAERPLAVIDHHGGPMDWYSADAATESPLAEPAAATAMRATIPMPLEYPGAPHSRFWEIEDANVDIGGYPPDTAHFATMLLVDLVYSHGDDWFLFPVAAKAGHIVTIRSLSVTDSFGKTYSSEDLDNANIKYPGLHAPGDFSIFKCDGLKDESLVLWPVAESPLESAPVERVQFGVDEHSNVLWALERIVDTREVNGVGGEPDDGHPQYPAAVPVSNLSGKRQYTYVPAAGVESRWHPYILDWKAESEPAFTQWGLADYSLQVPRPTPHPEAQVLKAGTAAAPQIHRISAAAMARGGLELERRWQLARDMTGRPVLWVQRQRRVLRNPPARTIRFDVMEESEPVP
ncbi:hypothetical protein NKH93_30185 [Mesorhizobium sp. M0954]|uniref:hypothetical protein n=1 Tax=Mesorhizobium sp. M0954 TaxID=2957032 RepID=UPI00333917BB